VKIMNQLNSLYVNMAYLNPRLDPCLVLPSSFFSLSSCYIEPHPGSNLNVDKQHASGTILRAQLFPNAAGALKFFTRHKATVVLGSIKRQNQSHQFRRLASSCRSATLDKDALLVLLTELSKRTIQVSSARTPERDTLIIRPIASEKLLRRLASKHGAWSFIDAHIAVILTGRSSYVVIDCVSFDR
jgi:hypothetical protein